MAERDDVDGDSVTADRPAVALWLRLVPAGLLLVGVAVQAYRIERDDVTSWGAGPAFAMFAQLDHFSTRFVQLTAVTADGAVPFTPPEEADDEVRLYRIEPTSRRASDLAQAAAGDAPPGASTIVVELWTVGLDDGAYLARATHRFEVET